MEILQDNINDEEFPPHKISINLSHNISPDSFKRFLTPENKEKVSDTLHKINKDDLKNRIEDINTSKHTFSK